MGKAETCNCSYAVSSFDKSETQLFGTKPML